MAKRKSRKKGKRTRAKKQTVELDLSKLLVNLDKYDWIAIGITIMALVVRLFFSQHCFWIDESREMAIARNFIRGQGYTLYGEYYIQHPYVFYTLVGLSSIFFGMVDFAGIAVSVVTGALTVLLLYMLGKETYGKETGIIASLFLTFHPLHMFYSVRVINDIAVIFFIVLSMYLFVRFNRRNDWIAFYGACAAAALAMMTKMVAVVLPPLLILYIIFKKRFSWISEKRYWYGLGVFLVFILIYIIINMMNIGEPFPVSFYLSRFSSPGGVDVGPPTYYIENFLNFIRFPLALLFFWGILCTFLIRFRDSKFLLLWILVFLVVISAQSDKVDRYILPIIPQICVIAAFGLEKIIKDFKAKKYAVYGLVSIITLWVIYSLYTEAAYIIPAMASGFCGFKETGDWLKVNSGLNDPLMVGSDNQIAWYADRENIHHLPRTIQGFYEYINSTPIRYIIIDRWERTQPGYVFTPEGQVWYPNFLNDSRFPLVDVVVYIDSSQQELPASFIYGVI